MSIFDGLIANAMGGNSGGGGGGGGSDYFVINTISGTLDKTWQEITDALLEYGIGKVILIDIGGLVHSAYIVAETDIDEGDYRVGVYKISNFSESVTHPYITDSADGYPTND